MAFLESTITNVALPTLGRELHAELDQLQWVVNGYTLTLAAFVLLGGALGDRLGRRRIFMWGIVWFTVASVACGFAQTVEILILARFVQGVGAALLTPGSLALIQASFDRSVRAKAIGAWSGLSGVTTAIGPFLGGVLIDQASWRWIFWMNVPLAVACLWLCVKYVPESRDESESGRFDIAGALLGALALAGVTYWLIEPARPVWALVGGLVAAIAFVAVERARRDRAMMPLHLFSKRVFSGLNIYTVLVYGAFGGLFFFLTIYLQNAVGYSALQAGAAVVPVTLLMLVFSAWSGALATRIGPRWQLIGGPLVAALGAVLLHSAGHNYVTTVLPGVVVFGIGLTMLVAPLTANVLAAVEERHSGLASGVNNAAARAASMLAVAALPMIVGLSGTEYEIPAPLTAAYQAAVLWCAAALAAGAVVALVTRP
jgi:EmrB/QacA subfamily drug resistance transporter